MGKNMIFAVDQDWNIGYKGDMQFFIKKDLEHFKELTDGHVLIMGRKTFEALPGVLSNRVHLVLTRECTKLPNDNRVICCKSKEEVNQYLINNNVETSFVIGGEQVLDLFFSEIEYAYITKVQEKKVADRKIVNLEESPDFLKTFESEIFSEQGYTFTFLEYERIHYEKI